jgi:hypothetical protein
MRELESPGAVDLSIAHWLTVASATGGSGAAPASTSLQDFLTVRLSDLLARARQQELQRSGPIGRRTLAALWTWLRRPPRG